MSTSLPTSNAAIASYDRFHISTAERRIRNRSLCSLLCTPPLYPGYSAKLDKCFKSSFYQQSWKSNVSEIATSSGPMSPNSTTINLYPSSTRDVIDAICPFKVNSTKLWFVQNLTFFVLSQKLFGLPRIITTILILYYCSYFMNYYDYCVI